MDANKLENNSFLESSSTQDEINRIELLILNPFLIPPLSEITVMLDNKENYLNLYRGF